MRLFAGVVMMESFGQRLVGGKGSSKGLRIQRPVFGAYRILQDAGRAEHACMDVRREDIW
jgi:hypothetical protein